MAQNAEDGAAGTGSAAIAPTRGRDLVLGSGKQGWNPLSCFTYSQACTNTSPSCLTASPSNIVESSKHGATTLDQDSYGTTCTHTVAGIPSATL